MQRICTAARKDVVVFAYRVATVSYTHLPLNGITLENVSLVSEDFGETWNWYPRMYVRDEAGTITASSRTYMRGSRCV